MAPPVTPSPHRFLVDKNKSRTNQPSSLRPSQFKQRPSFNFETYPVASPLEDSYIASGSKHDSSVDAAQRYNTTEHGTPTEARLRGPKFDLSASVVQDADLITSFDTIHDASQHTAEAAAASQVMEGNGDSKVSHGEARGASPVQPDDIGTHSSKRVRLSEEVRDSSLSPTGNEATRTTFTQTAHKFITSPPRNRPPSAEQETGVSRRQAFLRPASPEGDGQTIDPHLLQFSPHRKGKTYEPGGLAASMQGHLMDMTSSGSFALPGRDDRQWTFTVVSVQASVQFMLVEASIEQDKRGKFLLAGSRMTPKPGDIVHVQGLTWPCELDGVQWLVCIDWKVTK